MWSDSAEGARYQRSMAATNPSSPLAYLPRGSNIRVEVKSVSPLSDGRAMIRFNTTVTGVNGRSQAPQLWVSLVGHSFSSAAMSESDRYLNPLGFQVSSYRRDPETLPEEGIVNGTRVQQLERIAH